MRSNIFMIEGKWIQKMLKEMRCNLFWLDLQNKNNVENEKDAIT